MLLGSERMLKFKKHSLKKTVLRIAKPILKLYLGLVIGTFAMVEIGEKVVNPIIIGSERIANYNNNIKEFSDEINKMTFEDDYSKLKAVLDNFVEYGINGRNVKFVDYRTKLDGLWGWGADKYLGLRAVEKGEGVCRNIAPLICDIYIRRWGLMPKCKVYILYLMRQGWWELLRNYLEITLLLR